MVEDAELPEEGRGVVGMGAEAPIFTPAFFACVERMVATVEEDKLLAAFLDALSRRKGEKTILCLGEALCRLGVAPVWRFHDRDPSDFHYALQTSQILRVLDLQWLARHYPEHKPGLQWTACFNPTNPERQYLAWHRAVGRSAWRKNKPILSGLRFSEEVALELARIVPEHLLKRRASAFQRRGDTYARLKSDKARARDKREKDERDSTFQIRLAIWQAGELARRAPTLTAHLTEMMPKSRRPPESSLNRGTIARHLAHVRKVINTQKKNEKNCV